MIPRLASSSVRRPISTDMASLLMSSFMTVWEDMIPGKEVPTETDAKPSLPSPVARYNATLAAKASPIPKGGNYTKGPGSTTHGYTYILPGTSPLKPITSIPYPPHPRGDHHPTTVSPTQLEPRLPARPNDLVPTDSQIPDLTIGAGWNAAKKRAMAKKRREVMVRALKGRTSDESSTEGEEEIVPHEREARHGTEHESIEAFESVDVRRTKGVAGPGRGSDDFDSDGIAWGQVDADAVEATASQQAARTPRPLRSDATPRDISCAPPYVKETRSSPPPTRTTFIDRLKAVNVDHTDNSASKKRKRDHLERHDVATANPTSDMSVMDGTSTPPYVSACGTLTPPETDRRDLGAFGSAADLQGLTSTVSGAPGHSAVTPAGGNVSVHPLVEALNKDLIRRDRKAAADEKSREMLRGRVKALEGRVRELEAELRRVKSEKR